MKFTLASVRDFLSILPAYEALPVTARRDLISIEKPGSSFALSLIRGSVEVLREAGFLSPTLDPNRFTLPPDRQEFVRMLRTLNSHSVFQGPSFAAFAQHMEQHLNTIERRALGGSGTPAGNLKLFRQLTSPVWPEDFLAAKDNFWEKPYLTLGSDRLFPDVGALKTAQSLVEALWNGAAPIPLRELASIIPDPEKLSRALYAAMRYGLLFGSLDRKTLEPIAGVWPGIAKFSKQKNAPPPENVTVSETVDCSSFLLEDLTTLLIHCATNPIKLKATDGHLFAKTIRDLAVSLRPFPKWIEKGFNLDAEMRVPVAAAYAFSCGFALRQGHSPERMELSDRGKRWLGLSSGDRLRVLMDGMLNRRQEVPGFEKFEGAQIELISERFYFDTSGRNRPDLENAMLESFRKLKGDGFYSVAEILAYSRVNGNPLLAVLRADKNAVIYRGYQYSSHPGADELQEGWQACVYEFIRGRLFPLGAVRLGVRPGGLCISITQAGRYFLLQSKAWEWEEVSHSQVIVQPNFEVTFLGESPAAEAEIGRFAERRGHQIGALFQITKKSIFAAAAAGMTADGAIETLKRFCSLEVPSNVSREIRGWFAQCRTVSFESAMLIRCPDRETALRIIALSKGNAIALTETVLQYKDPGTQRPALVKKLKDLGVLVTIREKAEPKPERPRWVRGRW